MTQKTAARRMLQSAPDIPRFSVSRELNADGLAALRSRISNEPGVLGSEGGNVGYLDGSARWKPLDLMDVYPTGEWGISYLCMRQRRPTAGRRLVTNCRNRKVDCPCRFCRIGYGGLWLKPAPSA